MGTCVEGNSRACGHHVGAASNRLHCHMSAQQATPVPAAAEFRKQELHEPREHPVFSSQRDCRPILCWRQQTYERRQRGRINCAEGTERQREQALSLCARGARRT